MANATLSPMLMTSSTIWDSLQLQKSPYWPAWVSALPPRLPTQPCSTVAMIVSARPSPGLRNSSRSMLPEPSSSKMHQTASMVPRMLWTCRVVRDRASRNCGLGRAFLCMSRVVRHVQRLEQRAHHLLLVERAAVVLVPELVPRVLVRLGEG
eukprot:scaffold21068_cov66-Phaeocystis_antarctica.AAC.1